MASVRLYSSGSCVGIDNDSGFLQSGNEIWQSIKITFSSDLLAAIPSGNYSGDIYQPGGYQRGGDYLPLGIKNESGTFKWSLGGGTGFGVVVADTQYYLETHIDTSGGTVLEIKVDGSTIYTGTYSPANPGTPFGINTIEINGYHDFTFGLGSTKYIEVDDLAFSLLDWVSNSPSDLVVWDFESSTSLEDAWDNYPFTTPPNTYVCSDPSDTSLMEWIRDPIETDDSDTVYLTFSVLSDEIFDGIHLDSGTVRERFTVTTADVEQYTEAPTVYMELSVQGGECYSTAILAPEGEASKRWLAFMEPTLGSISRWDGEAEPRFEADVTVQDTKC